MSILRPPILDMGHHRSLFQVVGEKLGNRTLAVPMGHGILLFESVGHPHKKLSIAPNYLLSSDFGVWVGEVEVQEQPDYCL